LAQENRLNTWRLVHLPAVSEWSDLYDRHRQNCVFFQSTLPVRLNMIEPNGQALSRNDRRLFAPKGSQARYTGELLLRTRPKTYRAIVRELAEPNASVNGISRRYLVSNHTVMGIREREAKGIAERKKTLAAMLANVAELGAERMEETIGKAKLRDAAIGTGIAVDKMLALTGQTPAVAVQVVLPTPEEEAERRARHDRLDAVTAKLAAIEKQQNA
jgi:transposase-like protein